MLIPLQINVRNTMTYNLNSNNNFKFSKQNFSHPDLFFKINQRIYLWYQISSSSIFKSNFTNFSECVIKKRKIFQFKNTKEIFSTVPKLLSRLAIGTSLFLPLKNLQHFRQNLLYL